MLKVVEYFCFDRNFPADEILNFLYDFEISS